MVHGKVRDGGFGCSGDGFMGGNIYSIVVLGICV